MKTLYDKIAVACWANPFFRGVSVALLTILALVLCYIIIRFVLQRKFGKRRCPGVLVELEHGNIMISQEAIASALKCELEYFKELKIRKIVLYVKRKEYSLEICGSFTREDKHTPSLPEVYKAIRPLLLEKLSSLFGIDNLVELKLNVEQFADKCEDEESVAERIPDLNLPDRR